MMNVDNSKGKWPLESKDYFLRKNILQQQHFIESLAETSEPIRIPSSVMKFAVIHSLGLMRHMRHVYECPGERF